MGKIKYRIVEETRKDEYGETYTMYRAKKKFLNLFWVDIGGEWSIGAAKNLIYKDCSVAKLPLPKDKIIAEYEL